MIEINYIPGLNTFNDRHIHIGVLRFSEMHSHLSQAFGERDIKLIPYYSARNSLSQKIEDLYQQITDAGRATLPLVGHSTGGIIARALAPRLKSKVLVTFGCPHGGNRLADIAVEKFKDASLKTKILRILKYDVSTKLNYFSDLTSQSLGQFNLQYPIQRHGFYNIVCSQPHRELPLIFKMLSIYAQANSDHTDGIVSTEEQKCGQEIAAYQLDHLSQIGFFKHIVSPKRKKQAVTEFNKLLTTIEMLVKPVSTP